MARGRLPSTDLGFLSDEAVVASFQSWLQLADTTHRSIGPAWPFLIKQILIRVFGNPLEGSQAQAMHKIMMDSIEAHRRGGQGNQGGNAR